MNLYFVMHAKPVSQSGKIFIQDSELKKANNIFKKFFNIYEAPEIIFTSEKNYSFETGRIINKYCPEAQIMSVPDLNPGCAADNFDNIIQILQGYSSAVIVGHMPDLLEFISANLSEDYLALNFKHLTICHVKDNIIESLIQPEILEK